MNTAFWFEGQLTSLVSILALHPRILNPHPFGLAISWPSQRARVRVARAQESFERGVLLLPVHCAQILAHRQRILNLAPCWVAISEVQELLCVSE